ncbi:MAG: glutamyl-tRNA amidotransferase [Candidatus Fluviicola riflensis]|nr:MAG: glutamyl-tRNA amidotransferase [Candidatus Fluviicola riflensis]OGS76723.1 MAG: glutamyl-tRNA amidotransferase [Candidatus Fluviicola riflensis]OGS82922.1 MAG: glutamyl-tRNA amidotransferase [Fluviicola sp. RIFCSPHIGHO2_01_FULL_43_53]OGS88453.1 MAG: glutamyl-tRNA amidotransferase [Fluviicola sp. RIFCSPHIGHO2_12_FULL_43_24]
MSLTERINQDIKTAMLAKDKDRLAALRDIKSKLMLEATSGSGEVTEEAANKIVLKLYKQRMDTYQLYVEQNREDLASDELLQAKVIEEYMPKMMSDDEVRAVIAAKIAQVGAAGPQDMGKVMGPVSGELAGKADGKRVAELVKEALAK